MKNEIIKFLENNKDKKIALFSDMDGVIVQFEFDYNNAIVNDHDGSFFDDKKPINTVINFFKEINKYDNVDFYILSACGYERQTISKSNWLDQYAPFFEKDKRIYVVKETTKYTKETKSDIKTSFIVDKLKEYNYDYILYFEDEYTMLKKAHSKIGDKIICVHISNFLD